MNILTDILCDSSSLMAPLDKLMPPEDISSKNSSLHLLNSVSHISTMKKFLSSSSSPSNINLFNPSSHISIPQPMETGYDDPTSFPSAFSDIVPPWLTQDFSKVSESLPSDALLSNVADMYQPSEEAEQLDMLELGFPSDLSTSNINHNAVSESQKLLAPLNVLPMGQYSNSDPLLLSSYNMISTSQLGPIGERMDYPKNVSGHHDSSQSLLNSVLPYGNDLLHLPMPDTSLAAPCLTTTSSPCGISLSQSQSQSVCDKLPQLNFNNLDSLLGSETDLSAEIQRLHQNLPSLGRHLPSDIHFVQSGQVGFHSYPPNQLDTSIKNICKKDSSVQVSLNNFGEILKLIDNCTACGNVNPQSAIDVVQCFKCKFCDFINLHKCIVDEHINSIHSNPILKEISNAGGHAGATTIVSSPIIMSSEKPVSLYSSTSVNSSVILTDAPINWAVVNDGSHASISCCEKCGKLFSDYSTLKLHLASDHKDSYVPPKDNPVCLQNMLEVILNSPTSDQRSETISQASDVNGQRKIVKKFDLLEVHENQQKLAPDLNVVANHVKSFPAKKIMKNLVSYNITSNEVNLSQNSIDLSPIVNSHRKIAKKFDPLPVQKNHKKPAKDVNVVTEQKKNPSAKKSKQKSPMKNLDTYICEVKGCNVRFSALDNLEYHKRCHNSGAPGFTCPECEEKFGHWKITAGHLWREHQNDMELYSCDKCSYRCYSLSQLLNIHRRIHNEERQFLCDMCGKDFKNRKQFRSHKERCLKCTKRKPPNTKCRFCQGQLPSVKLLRFHLESVHNVVRNMYMCTLCDYKTPRHSTFRLHMRSHTGEKPFACNECEFRTTDHNSLRRHKMKHSGIKPYKCPYCSYSAIQSSTFKTHIQKQHPEYNTLVHSCYICKFQTLHKSSLEAHIKEHEMQNTPVNNRATSPSKTTALAEAIDISISRGDASLSHYDKTKTVLYFLNDFSFLPYKESS